MGDYVERKELDGVKKSINEESNLLIQSIKSFNNNANDVDAVLKKLKIYYNTSAGELKNNKIANTKFSSKSLSSLCKSMDNIEIDYYLGK